MEILAHRGYWTSIEQKNSKQAIEASFANSWGIETDIRDYSENLVISHDIASYNNYTFAELLQQWLKAGKKGTLGLNVKADGLSDLLNQQLKENEIKDYFVFDMSIPETLRYLKLEMNVFIRSSEYEQMDAVLLQQAKGIWLDAFTSVWYDSNFVESLLTKQKKIAIVSCELHGRSETGLWEMIKSNNWYKNENIMLCTDFPDKAIKYFEIN